MPKTPWVDSALQAGRRAPGIGFMTWTPSLGFVRQPLVDLEERNDLLSRLHRYCGPSPCPRSHDPSCSRTGSRRGCLITGPKLGLVMIRRAHLRERRRTSRSSPLDQAELSATPYCGQGLRRASATLIEGGDEPLPRRDLLTHLVVHGNSSSCGGTHSRPVPLCRLDRTGPHGRIQNRKAWAGRIQQLEQEQDSPRHACHPSRAATAAITSAATGSAHHQPSSAFASSPASSTAER